MQRVLGGGSWAGGLLGTEERVASSGFETQGLADSTTAQPRLAPPPSLFEKSAFQRTHPVDQRLREHYCRAASLLRLHSEASRLAAFSETATQEALRDGFSLEASAEYLRALLSGRRQLAAQKAFREEAQGVADGVALPFFASPLWKQATPFLVQEANASERNRRSLQLGLLFLCLVNPGRSASELSPLLHCLEELLREDAAFCGRAVCELLQDQRPLRLLYRHRIVADVLPLLLSAECRAHALSASISLLHQVYVQHVAPDTCVCNASGGESVFLSLPSNGERRPRSGAAVKEATFLSRREAPSAGGGAAASASVWSSESEVSATTHCLAVLRFLRRQQQRRRLLSEDPPSAAAVFLLCTKLLAASAAAGSVLLLSREAEELAVLLWKVPSARVAALAYGGSLLVSALGAVSRVPFVRSVIWSALLRPPSCRLRKALLARTRLWRRQKRSSLVSDSQGDLGEAALCVKCQEGGDCEVEDSLTPQDAILAERQRRKTRSTRPPVVVWLLCCPPLPALAALLLPKELQKDLLHFQLAETRASQEGGISLWALATRRAEAATRLRWQWFWQRWIASASSASCSDAKTKTQTQTQTQTQSPQSPWLMALLGDVTRASFLAAEKAFFFSWQRSSSAAVGVASFRSLACASLIQQIYDAIRSLPPERLLLCRAELRMQLALPWLLFAAEAARPSLENFSSAALPQFPWSIRPAEWKSAAESLAAVAASLLKSSSRVPILSPNGSLPAAAAASASWSSSILSAAATELPSEFVKRAVADPLTAFLDAVLPSRLKGQEHRGRQTRASASEEARAAVAALLPLGVSLADAPPNAASSSGAAAAVPAAVASSRAAVAASVEFLGKLAENYSPDALPLFASSLAAALAAFSLLQLCTSHSKVLRLCLCAATASETTATSGNSNSSKGRLGAETLHIQVRSQTTAATPSAAASASWALNSQLLCGSLLRRFGVAMRVVSPAETGNSGKARRARGEGGDEKQVFQTKTKSLNNSPRFAVFLERAPGGAAGSDSQTFAGGGTAFPVLFRAVFSACNVVVNALTDADAFGGLLKKLDLAAQSLERATLGAGVCTAAVGAAEERALEQTRRRANSLDAEVASALSPCQTNQQRRDCRGEATLESSCESPALRGCLDAFLNSRSLLALTRAGKEIPRAESLSARVVAKALSTNVPQILRKRSAVVDEEAREFGGFSSRLGLQEEVSLAAFQFLAECTAPRTATAAFRLLEVLLARSGEDAEALSKAAVEAFRSQTPPLFEAEAAETREASDAAKGGDGTSAPSWEAEFVKAALLLVVGCLETEEKKSGDGGSLAFPIEALSFWGFLLASVSSKTQDRGLVGWTALELLSRAVAVCLIRRRRPREEKPEFEERLSLLLVKAAALLWTNYAVAASAGAGGKLGCSVEQVVKRDVRGVEPRLLAEAVVRRGWSELGWLEALSGEDATLAVQSEESNQASDEKNSEASLLQLRTSFENVFNAETDGAVVVETLPCLPSLLQKCLAESALTSIFLTSAALERIKRTARMPRFKQSFQPSAPPSSLAKIIKNACREDGGDSSPLGRAQRQAAADDDDVEESIFRKMILADAAQRAAADDDDGASEPCWRVSSTSLEVLFPSRLFGLQEGAAALLDEEFCLGWRTCVLAWRVLGLELGELMKKKNSVSGRGAGRGSCTSPLELWGLSGGVFRSEEKTTSDFGLRLCRALRMGCFPLLPWSHCSGCCKECRAFQEGRRQDVCIQSQKGEALVVMQPVPSTLQCLGSSASSACDRRAVSALPALTQSLFLLKNALDAAAAARKAGDEGGSSAFCEEWKSALVLLFTQSLLPAICAAPPCDEVVDALLECAGAAAASAGGEDEREAKSECLGAVAREEAADCLFSVLLVLFKIHPLKVGAALGSRSQRHALDERSGGVVRGYFRDFFLRRTIGRDSEAFVALPKAFAAEASSNEAAAEATSATAADSKKTPPFFHVSKATAEALLKML